MNEMLANKKNNLNSKIHVEFSNDIFKKNGWIKISPVWKVSLPDWNIPAVPIPLAGLWNFFTIHPLEDRYNLMAFGKRLVTELKRVGKKHTAERYSPEHC